MINVVTDLLYRTERERSSTAFLFNSISKVRGRKRLLLHSFSFSSSLQLSKNQLLLFSKKKKVSHPFAPLFFSFFEILNRLKTKQNQKKKSFIVKSVLWSLVCWIDFLLPVWGVSGEWKPFLRLLFWNWPLLARPPPPPPFFLSKSLWKSCGKICSFFLFCCSLAV